MNDLALATMFTGGVILMWGLRAFRSHFVNILLFKLYSRYSTWIFGFVSTICGLLMLLTGLAAANSMTAELVEILAKSGLYIFGIGWVLALIMEGIDRLNWRIHPESKPIALRAEQEFVSERKQKRKAKTPDMMDREDHHPDSVIDSADSQHNRPRGDSVSRPR